MPLHPTITYTEHELMPGRPMFRCDALAAVVQVSSCAGMWERANVGANPRADRCRGCRLGAVHAGQAMPDASALRGVPICPRCGGTDKRLVSGWLCISCYNRQREAVVGRNAKGKPPEKIGRLVPRAVQFVCQGETRRIRRELTVSTDELVVELLRDQPAKVLMGWGVGKAVAGQVGLW